MMALSFSDTSCSVPDVGIFIYHELNTAWVTVSAFIHLPRMFMSMDFSNNRLDMLPWA